MTGRVTCSWKLCNAGCACLAFPRTMRLPDPFTPNLKVDLLAEISQAPVIMSNYAQALNESGLMADVELYLQSGQPAGFLHSLQDRLVVLNAGYNVPLINSLVLHVGVKAIAQLNKKQGNSSMQHSAPMVCRRRYYERISLTNR